MTRNNDKGKSKRLILGDARRLSVMVLLVLSLAVGGTLAYISYNTDAVTNLFSGSTVTPTTPQPVIYENGGPVDPGKPKELDFDDGDPVRKAIKIKNKGATGYLRVRLTLPQQYDKTADMYVASNAGTTIDNAGFVAPTGTELVIGDYTLVFAEQFTNGASQDWAYNNGWFYYKRNLASQAETALLLSAVKASRTDRQVEIGVITEMVEDDASVANETWGLNASSSTGHYGSNGWIAS